MICAFARHRVRLAAQVVLAVALALAPLRAHRAMGAEAGQGTSLDGVGHDRGRRDAPVEVVEFSDFGCRYCARFAAETFPSLDAEFIQPGRVRWKLVPFVLGTFRNSREAAEAAECAAEQGAFWPMHDRLFVSRGEWSGERRPWERLRRYAAELRLDTARFAACAAGRAARRRVKRHGDAAARLMVRATPTFFVNGRRVEGAIPLPLFRQVLAEARAQTGEGVSSPHDDPPR